MGIEKFPKKEGTVVSMDSWESNDLFYGFPPSEMQGKAKETRPTTDLSFTDIQYDVIQKKETKTILRGVSGTVTSGSLMCIMGPSGSGKTSLIHIISGKIKSSQGKTIAGRLSSNNVEFAPWQFQRIGGLVTQEDIFNSCLTVEETLRFAAMFKLQGQRKERTDLVARQLQLQGCMKTYVGDDQNPYLKGISGGEKRRLAIAMEILDPSIAVLVLDEPTSGLDAAAALNVADLLRSLADTNNIAVACSLHQPRDTIIEQFNTLMVLADGRRMFYGGLSQYIPYLEGNLQCRVPTHKNPYDFLLDVLNPITRERLNISFGAIDTGSENFAEALGNIYEKSALRESMEGEQDGPQRFRSSMSFADLIKERRRIGCHMQFFILLQRIFLIKLRDPMVMMTQVSTAVLISVIFGIMYWQLYDRGGGFALTDATMCISMTTMMTAFLPFDVVMTFPLERKIFLRERKAGAYSSSTFYFARILADMPIHIFSGSILAGILYAMAGLRQNVFVFIGLNVICMLVAVGFLQGAGAMARGFEEANMFMMLVMMMSMMNSTGFVREVPSFLMWMREISFMGICADLALYMEFRDVDPVFGTPESVLASVGAKIRSDDDVRSVVWILVCVYLVARVFTFLAVKFCHTGRSFREDLAD